MPDEFEHRVPGRCYGHTDDPNGIALEPGYDCCGHIGACVFSSVIDGLCLCLAPTNSAKDRANRRYQIRPSEILRIAEKLRRGRRSRAGGTSLARIGPMRPTDIRVSAHDPPIDTTRNETAVPAAPVHSGNPEVPVPPDPIPTLQDDLSGIQPADISFALPDHVGDLAIHGSASINIESSDRVLPTYQLSLPADSLNQTPFIDPLAEIHSDIGYDDPEIDLGV